jgi:hypothetical protein
LCEVVDWRPPKATTNFAFLIFCPKSDGQKDFMASSPIAIALRAVSPKYILTIGRFSVGCCVLPSSRSHRNPRPHCPLYFYIFFTLFAAQNDKLTASPTHSTRSNLLSNAPPIADAIIWLAVTSPCQMAAIEGRCSNGLSIFRWAPFWRPKHRDQTQRTRAQPPGAYIGLIGLTDAENGHQSWGRGQIMV